MLTKKQVKERKVDTQEELFLIKDIEAAKYVYQYATNEGKIKKAIFHEPNSANDVAAALTRSTGRTYSVEKIGA